MDKNNLDAILFKTQVRILEMVSLGQSLTTVLTTLIQEIEGILTGTLCRVQLLNEEEDSLQQGIGSSLDKGYLKSLDGNKVASDSGPIEIAAHNKETVIIKNMETDVIESDYKSEALFYGFKACVVEPILSSRDKVLGTLTIYYRVPIEPYKELWKIIKVFTHLLSVAIENRKIIEKLFQSEKKYRILAENIMDFVGILDSRGLFEYTSPSHEKYLGYSSIDLLGKFWLDYTHRDDANNVEKSFKKMVQTNKSIKITFRFKHKHGHWVFLEGKGSPILEEAGKVTRYVYVARDINEQKKVEQTLVETQLKFKSLYNNSLDAIFEIDSVGNYFSVNDVALTLTGYKREQLLTLGFKDLIFSGDLEKSNDTFTRVKRGEAIRVELRLIHKKGHHLLIDVKVIPVFKDGGDVNVIAFVQDITDKRRAEEEIRELAYKDVLTGLPNRYLFSLKLNEAVRKANDNKSSLGVLFIDFDNFKSINDTLGHGIGDKLLQQVVFIMQKCLRKQDLISRQGGDEFLILVEGVTSEEICMFTKRIIDEFNYPIQVSGHEIFITPSIGVCVTSELDRNAEILIKNADLAMYLAKEKGKNNYQFYTEDLNEKVVRKVQLENALRKAINNNEFQLHYQPQVDINTENIVGIEALLRWNPVFGPVSPIEFIPIAEETGLIVAIGEWVIEKACIQCKHWYNTGLLQVPVAVNVSARQFKDPNFTHSVAKILKKTEIPYGLLEIEITESVMIDVRDVGDIIHQLKKLGISIAIDDFGVGYSSLNMINNFDVDNLKIDQSFLHDVMKNKRSAGLLKAIIQLGREIGSDVVVEGIETKEQVDFLQKFNVIGQGYFYCRPLSVKDFEEYLKGIHQK